MPPSPALRIGSPQRRRLLAWYRANRRDLPWRCTVDSYAIWVSEVMLQQTRVDVVVPYYARWMTRFPSLRALAAATDEDVLAVWSGLGYYRRARNMRATAKAAGASLPVAAEALRQMPGIGKYTAAAVASIAHGEPVACVDGNVARVVARLAGIRLPRAQAGQLIDDLADGWLDVASPGDWNQAMMELGATVCTPRAPVCSACPLARECVASQRGLQRAIPPPKRKPAVPTRQVRFAVVERRGCILVVRRPDGLLAGLWSLPGGAGPLAPNVLAQTGVQIGAAPAVARVRHAFTHLSWQMHVHPAAVRKVPRRLATGAKWLAVADLPQAAVSTAMRRALAAAGVGA